MTAAPAAAHTFVSFSVHGKPTGKGRPRFTTRGGFPRAITPEKTRTAESIIYGAGLAAIKAQVGVDGALSWDGPVSVDMVFFFAIPPSWPKWRREQASNSAPQVSKPDLDNLQKAVLDGLGNLFWHDDAQVAMTKARKVYTTGAERTDVTVARLFL